VLPFAAPTFNGAHPAKKAVLMNKGRVPVISLPSEGLEALARATRARWAVDAEEPPPPRPYRELLMAVQLAARGGMDAAAAWARPGGRDDSGTRRDRAEASHWFYLDAQGKEQVRKTPSWPRSWANCSLLWLYSHRNAWANLHLLSQLNNFLARGRGRSPGRRSACGTARATSTAASRCSPLPEGLVLCTVRRCCVRVICERV
jgi:hypothetical protein